MIDDPRELAPVRHSGLRRGVEWLDDRVDPMTPVLIGAVGLLAIGLIGGVTNAFASYLFLFLVLVPFAVFCVFGCAVFPIFSMKYEKAEQREAADRHRNRGRKRDEDERLAEVAKSLPAEDVEFLTRNGWKNPSTEHDPS